MYPPREKELAHKISQIISTNEIPRTASTQWMPAVKLKAQLVVRASTGLCQQNPLRPRVVSNPSFKYTSTQYLCSFSSLILRLNFLPSESWDETRAVIAFLHAIKKSWLQNLGMGAFYAHLSICQRTVLSNGDLC